MPTRRPPDPASGERDPAAGECGLSLVELMMATVLTVVGLVAITNSCTRLHALQRLDSELGHAYRACQANLDQLRSMPLASLLAADGAGFDVPGDDAVTPVLRAEAGDPDGMPGEIRVRLERSAGGRALYRIETAARWRGASGSQSVALVALWGGTP